MLAMEILLIDNVETRVDCRYIYNTLQNLPYMEHTCLVYSDQFPAFCCMEFANC